MYLYYKLSFDFVNPEWFDTADRRYDPPLSDDGFIQAAELAARLKSEDIAHIFASPFLRTIQTADEIARVLDLPIELEAGLGEWHNPKWMSEHPEIHPQDILTEKYPSIDPDYRSYFTPKYPETKEDVNRRTAKTIKKLVAEFPENILIVGHGATVHGVTYGLVPDTEYFKVALASLTKIVRQENDKWKLELCADTSHLSKTESEIRFN